MQPEDGLRAETLEFARPGCFLLHFLVRAKYLRDLSLSFLLQEMGIIMHNSRYKRGNKNKSLNSLVLFLPAKDKVLTAL